MQFDKNEINNPVKKTAEDLNKCFFPQRKHTNGTSTGTQKDVKRYY